MEKPDYTAAEMHTSAAVPTLPVTGEVHYPNKGPVNKPHPVLVPPVHVRGYFPGETHRQLARKVRQVMHPRVNHIKLEEGPRALLLYFLRLFGYARMDEAGMEVLLKRARHPEFLVRFFAAARGSVAEGNNSPASDLKRAIYWLHRTFGLVG